MRAFTRALMGTETRQWGRSTLTWQGRPGSGEACTTGRHTAHGCDSDDDGYYD